MIEYIETLSVECSAFWCCNVSNPVDPVPLAFNPVILHAFSFAYVLLSFKCPVYDLDNNVAFIGMYQTMTKKGAITVQVVFMCWKNRTNRKKHLCKTHLTNRVASRLLTSLSVSLQRKDFPSNSFYVVVVVKTEDEACGGPLRFYPLRPDELIDAGNRSKVLDVMVFPAINCKLHMCKCELFRLRYNQIGIVVGDETCVKRTRQMLFLSAIKAQFSKIYLAKVMFALNPGFPEVFNKSSVLQNWNSKKT